jgi:hypothetical protein
MAGATSYNPPSGGTTAGLFLAGIDEDTRTELWRVAEGGLHITRDVAAAEDPLGPVIGVGDVLGYPGGFLTVQDLTAPATSVPTGFVLEIDRQDGDATRLETFGPGPNTIHRVVATSADRYAISGEFSGQLNVGSSSLVTAGGTDIVIANRDGAAWTSLAIGSDADDRPLALREDTLGRLWLLAWCGGTTSLGTETIGPGLVLVVLDDLAPVWSVTLGGSEFATDQYAGHGAAIERTVLGDMIVASRFAGTASIDGREFVARGTDSDWLLVRLRMDGSAVWGHARGGDRRDSVEGLAVVGDVVIATGYFAGAADLGGPVPLHNQQATPGRDDEYDGFVAAYVLDTGSYLWARRFGGGGAWEGQYAAVSDGDGVIVVGDIASGPYTVGLAIEGQPMHPTNVAVRIPIE